MANLRDLAARMTKTANELPKSANALKVKVATAIISDLVRNTPVDTSQAISNWQITLDSANAHAIPAILKGSHGSTYEISSDRALVFALKILKTAKPGQSVWIQNKLPYIRRLNDGYSSQQPAGFVERAQLIGRKVAEQGL